MTSLEFRLKISPTHKVSFLQQEKELHDALFSALDKLDKGDEEKKRSGWELQSREITYLDNQRSDNDPYSCVVTVVGKSNRRLNITYNFILNRQIGAIHAASEEEARRAMQEFLATLRAENTNYQYYVV